jgi:hypothetical protein
MKKVLLTLLVLVIGLAPAVVGAQAPSSPDKSSPSSGSSSPGTSTPGSSGGASPTSPSASPPTGGGTSTDLSQHKTQADCESAGGQWQATTSSCQKKASQ